MQSCHPFPGGMTQGMHTRVQVVDNKVSHAFNTGLAQAFRVNRRHGKTQVTRFDSLQVMKTSTSSISTGGLVKRSYTGTVGPGGTECIRRTKRSQEKAVGQGSIGNAP